MICSNCQIAFEPSRHQLHSKGKVRFCSTECMNKYRSRESVTATCSNCDVVISIKQSAYKRSISKRFFCSRSCSTSFNNKQAPKRSALCKRCKKPFHRDSTYRWTRLCPECRTYQAGKALSVKTLQDVEDAMHMKGKHRSWVKTEVHRHCRSVHKHLLKSGCIVCGFEYVELCHIKPISSFDKATPLSVINDRNNVVALCPNHHAMFDQGKLKLPI